MFIKCFWSIWVQFTIIKMIVQSHSKPVKIALIFNLKIPNFVQFLKMNVSVPVNLGFPSNLENLKSRCGSKTWSKNYFGAFWYHRIIMPLISGKITISTCQQLLALGTPVGIDSRKLKICTCSLLIFGQDIQNIHYITLHSFYTSLHIYQVFTDIKPKSSCKISMRTWSWIVSISYKPWI